MKAEGPHRCLQSLLLWFAAVCIMHQPPLRVASIFFSARTQDVTDNAFLSKPMSQERGDRTVVSLVSAKFPGQVVYWRGGFGSLDTVHVRIRTESEPGSRCEIRAVSV